MYSLLHNRTHMPRQFPVCQELPLYFRGLSISTDILYLGHKYHRCYRLEDWTCPKCLEYFLHRTDNKLKFQKLYVLSLTISLLPSTFAICWWHLQFVCTQIRTDRTSVLIWIQTVWPVLGNYQNKPYGSLSHPTSMILYLCNLVIDQIKYCLNQTVWHYDSVPERGFKKR